MQSECIAQLKDGVQWEDVHALAHRIAIKGLVKLGVLRGSEDELFDKRVSVAFFPHGLGHYLGMDTHDTGGNPNYDDKDPMFRYLRVRGNLPAGSVITVEPGVRRTAYFLLLSPLLTFHDRFISADLSLNLSSTLLSSNSTSTPRYLSAIGVSVVCASKITFTLRRTDTRI